MYDVTKFEKHPGGKDPFIEHAGQDATDPFEDEGHSATAKKQMADFLVGKLEGASDEDDEDMEEVIDTNSGERMKLRKKVRFYSSRSAYIRLEAFKANLS